MGVQNIAVQEFLQPPIDLQTFELVERKGLGHPDTICDAVMETASVALSAEYIHRVGHVLHHNLDKGLLVAGQTTPTLGGGRVEAPMRIIFGDRATCEWQGTRLPVREIVEATTLDWFRKHLRYVEPQHLVFQNEIRPGSAELTDIFARTRLTANDTSAAVGYAPLSETEQLVLATEHYLNSPEFKLRHPEAGDDVKVMATRRHRDLHLTVALAFVDRFINSLQQYFAVKAEIEHELSGYVTARLERLDRVEIHMNALDDPERGSGGMYLTVLGTSAEGADSGEVGRGNRVNGLISFNRPMTLEAAAGKNPVSHVGKIYNLLSHDIANRIYEQVPGIREVYVWLCSQIGRPLDDPWSVSIQLSLMPGVNLADVASGVRNIVDQELQKVDSFVERLCRGELPVC